MSPPQEELTPANAINAASGGSAAHEERSRQALIRAAKTINWKGHNVLDAEGKVATTAAAIKSIEERNRNLLKLHSSIVMKHGVFLFGLVCVYGIDCCFSVRPPSTWRASLPAIGCSC
jgi:hypothetical protein